MTNEDEKVTYQLSFWDRLYVRFLVLLYPPLRERRMFARIQYPEAGALAGLPKILIDGCESTPVNLSLGGFMLRDSRFGIKDVGQQLDVSVVWFRNGRMETVHKAQIVQSRSGFTHFKFLNTDPRFYPEFNKTFEPGIAGTQLRRMQLKSEHKIQCIECWSDNSGNEVRFVQNDDIKFTAIVALNKTKYEFVYPGIEVPTNADNLDAVSLEQILIFLCNIQEPSEKILEMISRLNSVVQSRLETKSEPQRRISGET